MQVYERVSVTFGELEEADTDRHAVYQPQDWTMMELLSMIGHLPVRDQVLMVSNLLTVSGFTQAEIAEALGVSHKTFRNRLWELRRDMLERPTLK